MIIEMQFDTKNNNSEVEKKLGEGWTSLGLISRDIKVYPCRSPKGKRLFIYLYKPN